MPILRVGRSHVRISIRRRREGLMIRSPLNFLIASAMLLHAMLGCSWHHAHTCGQEPGDTCQVGDDQHENDCHESHQHLVAAEVESQEHSATHHDVCDRDVCDHDVCERDSVPDRSVPHTPCHSDCETGDCSFTQSSRVKPPHPHSARGGFDLSLAATLAASSWVARTAHDCSVDPGSSGASAICCSRPMTQVWRL